MFISQLFESKLNENAEELNIGDPVIVIGNVQFKGKTGEIAEFGKDKRFVIVDLYNHGRHSFHSSDVEYNDYADSEEEANDWQERGLGEDAQFGSIYSEELAQKVFDQNPNLPTTGRADELFQAGIAIAVQDLGKKRAQWEFNYDEDFFSDFVSAYGWLQRNQQGVAEGVADTMTMNDAVKVLRHFGADHFKTTSNELHFYKNGRPFSVELIWGDNAVRSVSLSQLNSATRKLKGQGVAEGYDSEELAFEIYAEFERMYPNLARRADERTVQAAIMDVLNYGGDNNPSALAQDVARAVKSGMQGVAEASKDSAPKMGSQERKMAAGAVKGAKDMSKSLPAMYRDKNGILRLKKDVKEA